MTRRDEGERARRWPMRASKAQKFDVPALPDSVDAALAEIERLPSGPMRSRMAEQLIWLLLGRNRPDAVAELRCLDQLVEIGDEDSPDRPGWPRIRANARCMALLRACQQREPIDYRAAMDEVNRLAAEFADDPPIRALTSAAQATLGLCSGQLGMGVLRPMLKEFGAVAGDHAEFMPLLELMSEYSDAVQAQQNDDSDSAFFKLLQVMRRSQEMPIPHMVRDSMAGSMSMLEFIQSQMADGSDVDLSDWDRKLAELDEAADRPAIGAEQRALYQAARDGTAAMREMDLGRIDELLADLGTEASPTASEHPEHIFHLTTQAMIWSRRSELSGSLDAVDKAIALLEQARQLAGGPRHQHWSFANAMLAQLLRRRGDRARSRRIALEGLRGYTWQVLQQPDPASARAVARTAAEEAAELAIWFLSDHAPADALRALDAGRGLMIFAATELRDPYTRLIEMGRPELAERWRAEAHPPAWLRRDVLEVLSRGTGLLDPPDLEEIQAALRALDADALVYLIAGTPPASGWAVIAPVEGPPRYLGLPNLVIETGTDIERYLTAIESRDATVVGTRDVGDIERAGFVDSVDALCGWAWNAAMGPLVKPYLDADPVPHLVLIPMGDLARVPWQAARGPDGRYLVERIGLSQAASARMLCETAAAEPVQLTSAGLVVADPDTEGQARDLPSARLEAYAIRQTFYPSATYLGRLPKGTVSNSGAGTPNEVRAWLRADGAEAGAMLHLASHGIMETALDSASSRLVLAGGDLAADELIGLLAGNTGHQIGLAVLAACHTGQSVHGYDEAYSLASMFLAAGVRSVLSTQWSVPDQDTSLLMYMFHHYLVTERRSPRDALRRAQIWMLDGDRTTPDRMPEPLRRTLERSDPAQVVAWAGFVHWGQ